MAWSIRYYNATVEQSVLELPSGLLARYLRLTDLMIEFGPNLGMPHSRSMGGGLFELRVKGVDQTMTHNALKRAALQRPDVRSAYEAMEPEFEILRQMLKARQDAGLTQAQVAERMGTKPPAVTRLESSLSSGKHSPSLSTLQKYAEAVGCRLEVRLVRSRTGAKPGRARTTR